VFLRTSLVGSPVRLSQKDIDALQRTLLALYQPRDLESFCKAVPKLLMRIIPANALGLITYDGGTFVRRAATSAKVFSQRDRFILKQLRPHLAQAWRNAKMLSARNHATPRPLSQYGLHPRETEIAGWVARGKTNPEIAVILQISPRTVEKHMEHILEKLKVENRAAAAVVISRSSYRDF